MKDYLFYVRQFSIIEGKDVLYVYHCKCDDPLHIVGEMYYRAFERISRISFYEDNSKSRLFWAEQGKKITEYRQKYQAGQY